MSIKRLFSVLFLIALFTMSVRETLDPDMWWHLRTGEYILQNGIPEHDVFSFTVPHHEWITHEWLSQLFMWLVYAAAGLPGLIVVFGLLITWSFWLVYRVSAGQPYIAAFVTLLAAVASAIVWGARPQIFNLLLTAVFITIVERVRQKTLNPRWLWALPPLMIAWANLHSGYLLGVVLLGTYAVGEAAQRWLFAPHEETLDWDGIRTLFGVTAVSFLVSALNPAGVGLWIYPFETLGSSAMQAFIQEWHSPSFHNLIFWPFAGLFFSGIVAMLFSQIRPTATDLLLFCGTMAAGLLSARHIPLFALVATPIVARHVVSALSETAVYPAFISQAEETNPTATQTALNWVILVVMLLGSLLWTASEINNNETAIAEMYPVAAVDYLETAALAEQPGYNSYNWGGYLIWRNLPVFVDGRADVYRDDFLFYYRQAFDGSPDWQEPLDDFAVTYVLIEQGSPLVALLDLSPEWTEAYADELAVIYTRE